MDKKWHKPPMPEDSKCRADRLITGTGRYGSRYIAKILEDSGLNTIHDVSYFKTNTADMSDTPVKPLVVVSWEWAIRWKDTRRCLHIVKSPLVCIRSIANDDEKAKLYVEYFTFQIYEVNTRTDDLLHHCMYRYYWWNKICEEISHKTIQIESIAKHVDLLTNFCGGNEDNKEKLISLISSHEKNFGHRTPKLPELTWNILFEKDEELAQKIKNQTEQYGYLC